MCVCDLVCVDMCVHVQVCMYMWLLQRRLIFTCLHVDVCVRVLVHMYAYMCVHVYT